MFDEKEYKDMFSHVTASTETHRRILNMEMTDKAGQGNVFRRMAVVVVVVILLVSVSVTAVAAVTGADWFEEFFVEKSGTILSENQLSYIEKNTVDYGQSVTHNGYTVTLQYAIMDGYSLHMRLKITAPEDVILDKENYGFVYQNKSQFYPADGSNPSRSGSWRTENEDKHDNIVYIPMSWSGSGFVSGSKWILELTDLCGYDDEEGFPNENNTIAEGVFRFEIIIDNSGLEEVEMVTAPVSCKAKVYDSDTEFHEVNITLTSLKLRPLSASLTINNYQDTFRLAGFGIMNIVMRDGSMVEMLIRSGGNGENQYMSKSPIVLSEVDHVLLPDGTKIPMPE